MSSPAIGEQDLRLPPLRGRTRRDVVGSARRWRAGRPLWQVAVMVEQLFAGPVTPLPAAADPSRLVMRLDEETTPLVRHAGGYEDFVAFVREVGEDPRSLHDDLGDLIAFFQRHTKVVGDESLLQAAGIFFGNSIAQRYGRAAWMVPLGGDPEMGLEGRGGFPAMAGVRGLTVHPDWTERYLASLDRWLRHGG